MAKLMVSGEVWVPIPAWGYMAGTAELMRFVQKHKDKSAQTEELDG